MIFIGAIVRKCVILFIVDLERMIIVAKYTYYA